MKQAEEYITEVRQAVENEIAYLQPKIDSLKKKADKEYLTFFAFHALTLYKYTYVMIDLKGILNKLNQEPTLIELKQYFERCIEGTNTRLLYNEYSENCIVHTCLAMRAADQEVLKLHSLYLAKIEGAF